MAKQKTTAEVEFKVINQEYNSAMKSMRTETTNLNSTLKLNESQFKATGDKGEYLKTKCDALTKQYDLSKQKVKETSDALEKTKSTMGENSTEATKLQNSLNHATSEMYELQVKSRSAKDELSKFGGVSDSLDKVSLRAKGVSEGFKAISATAIALSAASIAAFNNVDDGYDTIIKKTGATGETLIGLQDVASDIFTSIPVSIKDTGIAVGEVNTRFHETGDSLKDLSTLFLEFSNINETDLNNSIGMTSKIMQQWGLDTAQTSSLLGIITFQSQKTGISVDTLMNSVQSNGFVFKEMGLSIGESVTLLANFEEAGIDADSMMVGMKKAATNFEKEGKSMNTGLSDLISRLQDASTYQQAYSEVTGLFGSKAALSFATAAKEGRISLDGLSSDLSSYSDTVKNTFEATQDPIDKAKPALNALQEAGSALAGGIISSMVPAFETITACAIDFSNWFSGLDEKTQKTIGTMVLLVGGLSGGALAVSKVSKGISGLIDVFKKFSIQNIKDTAQTIANTASKVGHSIATGVSTVAQWAQTAATTAWNVVCGIATIATTALGAAFTFLTSPIGLVVLAIAAVIAIGILLVQNWDTVCAFGTETWAKIQSVFQDFDTFLTGVFTADWSNSFGAIGNVMNGFLSSASRVWDGVKTVFGGIVDFVAGVFTGDWSRAWEGVKNIFSGIFNMFAGIASAPLNAVIGVFNGFLDGINWCIRKINSISIDLPDFLGGAHIGFDLQELGKIPYLKNGGIVTSPTIAMVGEGKDSEAVIPLNMRSVAPLAGLIVKSMADINMNGNGFSTRIIDALQNMTFVFNIVCYIEGTPFTANINKQQMIAVKRGRVK